MNPIDFKVAVAAANGRPQRLVSIEHTDGREHRDTIDPNSRTSRKRLIHDLVRTREVEPKELEWLDAAIVAAADAADEHADQAVADVEERKSTADLLVDLALARYRIGRNLADEPFAVEQDGQNLALMFRGSRDALRSALAREFRKLHGRTPNSSALTDALTALQGDAYALEPEDVHLRLAEHDRQIVIDLGDSSGRAVVVGPTGWRVVDRSPVLFRRTAATGVLPVPESGGSLTELRELVNVSSETWPLVIGWLVASLIPNIPHPIMLLGGQQGTGKTTAAKYLGGIIDPSSAQLRSQPRDAETWAISASASWLVAVDNISTITDWWSDSLCNAVTGDGWLRRKLYTDGDLAVLSFRRVILLTSIDAGALRGDLGDRVLLVDLEPIRDTTRRTEAEIDAHYRTTRPRAFGALLTTLANTLAELPNVGPLRLPRMADFGRLLAALDRTADNADKSALETYMAERGRVAQTVVESDPVALAIESFIGKEGFWQGTAQELLVRITPEKPPKDWPRTPQGLGGRVKRLTPALEQAGVLIGRGREGHERTRRYHITRTLDNTCKSSSALSASSAAGEIDPDFDGGMGTTADDGGQPTTSACPPFPPEPSVNEWRADDADVADDFQHRLSDDECDVTEAFFWGETPKDTVHED